VNEVIFESILVVNLPNVFETEYIYLSDLHLNI